VFIQNKKSCDNNQQWLCLFLIVITAVFPTYAEAPLENSFSEQYLGCYKDQKQRDLSGLILEDRSMTTARCLIECGARGFRYAGTQYSRFCLCGNSYGKTGKAKNCKMPCSGNPKETCGGSWANSVYSVKGNTLKGNVAELTQESLIGTVWKFGRSNGSTIVDEIKLLAGGKMEGYYHPNEDHWGVEAGVLVFYRKDGVPSCRFVSLLENKGIRTLSGEFLFSSNVIHVLEEKLVQKDNAKLESLNTDGIDRAVEHAVIEVNPKKNNVEQSSTALSKTKKATKATSMEASNNKSKDSLQADLTVATKEVAEEPISQPVRELFNGALGKQWKELAAFGGNFKKFAKIEGKVLLVDVPEGNKSGKTGIRSADALFKIPEKESNFSEKLTFTFDPSRSSDYILAVIPSNWDGNLEWRSHYIRVGLQRDEENKNSLLTLWIQTKEMMKVNLDPESIEQLSIIIRPDRIVLVADGSGNILLQGLIPENRPIYKDGYKVSVLARAPKKGMSATLALKTITLEQQPYVSAKAEDDPTIFLDKIQKVVLFDGRILDKNWIKYQLHRGSSFPQSARFVEGALLVDVPEGIGWGKAGIASPEPLVWLDKFGKGAEARVSFKFDPEQTTGFVVALASASAENDYEPREPRALLFWRKNSDGNSAKVSLYLTPNKKYKPLWEQEVSDKMPEEVSFVLTPGGIQIEAQGISKDVIPWVMAAPSQSFSIFAYSHPEKDKEPVKMVLKQILLERKAGEPILPSKPQQGVAPLPVTALFNGKLNEWWEGAGVDGAEFSKFGRFENDRMIVDVPKKTSSWASAGLLSKKPILDFNERILSTSHKLKFKIDKKQTTGFEIMFHPGKYSSMYGANTKSIIRLTRCSKGACAGKYVLLLRINFNPNYIWSRTVDADWVENIWDGNLTIETGNRWMAVHLSGGPSVRANVSISKNSKLYMTVYSRNDESYGPAKFALEKITSEWVMPDGMSKMDRFLYVDDDDFAVDEFLDELSSDVFSAEEAIEEQLIGLPQ